MKDRSEQEALDDTRVLGDINPEPKRKRTTQPGGGVDATNDADEFDESIHAAEGGSNEDRTEHAGSRDVTEGTTGGVGTEVGGTRNLRTGTGATGTDIGNRPE